MKTLPSGFLPVLALFLLLAGVPGCVSVKTEPIKIEPIHITIDINHKIQRELDDYFRELDNASSTLDAESTLEATEP